MSHYKHVVLPLDKLTAYANNARTHTEDQVRHEDGSLFNDRIAEEVRQ